VLRNGVWNEEDAAVLVHGDIISIKLGDIVLADARLMDEDPLKIDQRNSCRVFRRCTWSIIYDSIWGVVVIFGRS
ncbi:hypothetical protein SOVF_175380 isoform B, partial [Spinacia oleracea]